VEETGAMPRNGAADAVCSRVSHAGLYSLYGLYLDSLDCCGGGGEFDKGLVS
jgi:hypothetical protein